MLRTSRHIAMQSVAPVHRGDFRYRSDEKKQISAL